MKVIKDEKDPLGVTHKKRVELMDKAYEYLSTSTDFSMTSLLQRMVDISETKEEVAFVTSGVIQMLTKTGAITLNKDNAKGD